MSRMTWWTPRTRMGLTAAALVAAGAAGGAGAVSMTRPAVTMAPTVATPIARLAASSGVVTVKGRVAEIYGDRMIVQDATGRTMVAGNREVAATLTRGSAVMVQGRYDDGQLRAAYLVDPAGQVTEVGPRHGPGGPGRDGPGGPGPKGLRHGPGAGPDRGPGGAPDGPPPPPPADGVAPPPPATGAVTPIPAAGATATPRPAGAAPTPQR
ncbi:hypothetical protein [Sphingomonas sp. CFBP 8760]|uniref:hypothetical protein n=1 Tax=Sphingomonas sp. CFBP 8760 TaxID=2775282 RepID=UPI001FCF0B54|nr:hypothetical protein [Sphingomonas sp. CFBP 8760]